MLCELRRATSVGGSLLLAAFTSSTLAAQQVELFPPGPYVSHCRAPTVPTTDGGDDDHNNVYYVAVQRSLADGTPAPDFYIHLWDGDNNATGTQSGTQDYNLYGSGQRSVYEYRLYGGVGASLSDEAPPGQDPPTWSGTLIDIDSDAGDDTLRTDDPDDLDDNSPEDLRDLDISLIGVDMDANPGDLISGLYIYKFVVDGTLGPGNDWNRYEVQATQDPGRTDTSGVLLYVYELTYAGRPTQTPAYTNLSFVVLSTPTSEIDIQTLDLDCHVLAARSQLTTPSAFYDDSVTYESGQQIAGGNWTWSSLNQQVSCGAGDGVTGLTYSTVGEEGRVWTLDIDPASEHNPFSVRLARVDGMPLPLVVDPVFVPYGSGPIVLSGTGLPQVGSSSASLELIQGPPSRPGWLLVSMSAAEITLGNGVVLYGSLPWLIRLPITYDAVGEHSVSVSIPAGQPAGEIYLQAMGFSGTPPMWHSNGLKMVILPQ